MTYGGIGPATAEQDDHGDTAAGEPRRRLHRRGYLQQDGDRELDLRQPGAVRADPLAYSRSVRARASISISTITDFLDQAIFGTIDTATLNPTGTYNGQAMTAADFTLSTDASGISSSS
jgi:hypothetical protein